MVEKNLKVCLFIVCRDAAIFVWISMEIEVLNAKKPMPSPLSTTLFLLLVYFYFLFRFIQLNGVYQGRTKFGFFFLLMLWHSRFHTCFGHKVTVCSPDTNAPNSFVMNYIRKRMAIILDNQHSFDQRTGTDPPWIFYVTVELICTSRYFSGLIAVWKHCSHSRFSLCHFQMIMCQNPPGSVLLT